MSDLTPAAIDGAEDLRDAYPDERITCEPCAIPARVPDDTLAIWPRPWREHDPEEVLCTECWAREAAQKTTLSQAEAEVLAVKRLGFSLPKMASAVGGYEDEVQEHLESIRDQKIEVEDEMDDLMRTGKLFDSL